ncbi:MAG TPA: DUF4352 domain-containing protein [Candidatus Acidoferrales bacterium]|nr:DUF4352 domain-containing protein [Candidatus Acidoferrales bacterium]
MGLANGRAPVRLASAVLVFLSSASAPVASDRSDAAPINAHPLNVPVTVIIEFGDQYLGSELYNAKITVLEIVRGEKAWDIIQQTNASNRPPPPDSEYLLARVRFEFSARASPAHYSYNLGETQFTAMAPDGREFAAPDLDARPKPDLSGTLRPGDSRQGWLAFLVPRKLSKPIMVFREDVGVVSHTGGGTWFQLYGRPAFNGQPNP